MENRVAPHDDGEFPGDPVAMPDRRSLTEREVSILEFEQRWVSRSGVKEEAIRVELGLSAARYYQLLNALIDTPAAVTHDPMLVRRLQRVRDARVRARAARIGRSALPGRASPDY